jgi:hypothetical protein
MKFAKIHHLELSGIPFAEIGPSEIHVFIGTHNTDGCAALNIEQAGQLRDWLNQALGSQSDRSAE